MATTPNPLKPAHIPGQNPNTPERLPGHTSYVSRDSGWQKSTPWIFVGLLIFLAALYSLGIVGH